MGIPGRDEMMAVGLKLDAFYRADEGLQRPDGLVLGLRVDIGHTPDRIALYKPYVDWEGVAAWLFDVYFMARMAGMDPVLAWEAVVTDIQRTDEWRQKHPPTPLPVPPTPLLEPLVRDGRWLKGATSGIRYVWSHVTAFPLAKMLTDGRESQAADFIGYCAGLGVGLRVFTMAHNLFRLDPAEGINAAYELADAAHGIRVQLVGLADLYNESGQRIVPSGFSETAHLNHLRDLGILYPNVLVDGNNEPLQVWQRATPAQMQQWMAGYRGSVVPWSLGAVDGPDDESTEYDVGGAFMRLAHTARKGGWAAVRHVREQQVIGDRLNLYPVDSEPQPAEDFTLAQVFARAAIYRVCGIGCTYHSQWGKAGRIPAGAAEVDRWMMHIRGLSTVPLDWFGAFSNLGWTPPNPSGALKEAESQSPDGRAYMSVNAGRCFTALSAMRFPVWREGWTADLVDRVIDPDGTETSVWYAVQHP